MNHPQNDTRIGSDPVAIERMTVWYVDIEHQNARDREAEAQEAHAQRIGRFAGTGVTCRCMWYGDVTAEELARLPLMAIAISGNTAEWADYDDPTRPTPSLEPLKEIIRSTHLPIIAFCGGHQLVAKAFGARVGHIDEDHNALSEYGDYYDITLEKADDPIFAGLSSPARFMEFHHDELKELHKDFIHLASTPLSRFQAVRHKDRILYTSQFHPEQDKPADIATGQGGRYLTNFFNLCRTYWAAKTL